MGTELCVDPYSTAQLVIEMYTSLLQVTQTQCHSGARNPVYTREDVQEYFGSQSTWVMFMGSSHAYGIAARVLVLMVGHEQAQRISAELLRSSSRKEGFHLDSVVTFDGKNGTIDCFSGVSSISCSNSKNQVNSTTSQVETVTSYFSDHMSGTYGDVVYYMKRLENIYVPESMQHVLAVEVGLWYAWTIANRKHFATSRKLRKLWSNRHNITTKSKFGRDSIEWLIEYDLIQFLEYLRDKWPRITEVLISPWHNSSVVPSLEFTKKHGFPAVRLVKVFSSSVPGSKKPKYNPSIKDWIPARINSHYSNALNILHAQRFFQRFIPIPKANFEGTPVMVLSSPDSCYRSVEKVPDWPKYAFEHCDYSRMIAESQDLDISNSIGYSSSRFWKSQQEQVTSGHPKMKYEEAWDSYHLTIALFAILSLLYGILSNFKPQEKATQGSKPKQLKALGAARFIASVHVVLGHLVRLQPRPVYSWPIFSWGYTWVPWFMMVSGFILTYSRVNSKEPSKLDPIPVFMRRRLLGMYPLYLAALLVAISIDWVKKGGELYIPPAEMLASLLLLQAWFPTMTENSYQTHCWFVSCIVPYWLLHNHMYLFMLKRSSRTLCRMLAFCSILPFAGLVVIPTAMGEPLTWFKQRTPSGAVVTWLDTLVVMLKFHPFFYLHIYVAGMLLAFLVQRRYFIVPRNGLSASYFGLFSVFLIGSRVGYPAAKLVCRLGGLIPLQGLILAVISENDSRDPLVYLFSMLNQLGDLSYPQYIFQFIAWNTWKMWTGVGYWVWLESLSLIGFYFIQKRSGELGIAVRNSVILIVSISLVYSWGRQTSNSFKAPYKITTLNYPGTGIRDVSIAAEISDTYEIINPSIYYSENELWVSGRGHKYQRIIRASSNASINMEEIEIWDSVVVLNTLSLESYTSYNFQQTTASFGSSLWRSNPDMAFHYQRGNRSLYSKQTHGFEDPRLFSFGNKLMISGVLGTPRNANVTLPDSVFITSVDAPANFTLVQRYDLGSAPSREKNWMAFDTGDGILRFVTLMNPFTVIQVCQTMIQGGIQTKLESVVEEHHLFGPLDEMGYHIHGGANPVPYTNGTFLGIFHTLQGSKYRNYFFKFKFLKGRWRVLMVSDLIPLFEAPVLRSDNVGINKPMTFASGLTIVDDLVLVSCGSSNKDARLVEFPLEHVIKLFNRGVRNPSIF